MNRKDLLSALEKIMVSIGQEYSIHGDLNYLCFDDDCIRTYNGTIEMIVPFEIGFHCYVQGKSFYNLIKSISDKEIDMNLTDDILKIKYGKSVVKFTVIRQSDFPNKKDIPKKWDEVPKDFVDGIKHCLFTVARESDVVELENMYFKGDYIYSSDRYRASRYKMSSSLKGEFLLPRIVGEVISRQDEIRGMVVDENSITFNLGDCSMISRKTEGKYPIKDSMFDGKDINYFNVSKDMEEYLNRSVIMNEGLEKLDFSLHLGIKGNKFTFVTEGSKLGKLEEELLIENKDLDVSFNINPSYLSDILKFDLEMGYDGENKIFFRNGNFKHIITTSV